MLSIILYSRPSCALCEEAEAMLTLLQKEYTIDSQVVNIEKDERLHEAYQLSIPVLELNGSIIAEGRINWNDVEQALTSQSE
ncbi:glutaredoxin family protein [Aureibacillus halotolerans]|uniref:Glutaredoxin n=1 Tax=Aureibacillus halotolerans TaxID=1508390 RepID=A0A4R6TTI5_9BACI|nr:glutaredoxin family protein [Aureibacillus halotolerans]TDQ36988.1 glutaredoxin [Aureibacillus halotolerans]